MSVVACHTYSSPAEAFRALFRQDLSPAERAEARRVLAAAHPEGKPRLVTNLGAVVLSQARTLAAAGLSLIPVRRDGSKAPAVPWKEFQARHASRVEIDGWFSPGRHGVGIVCGAVSGNLTVLDFEAQAAFEAWAYRVRSGRPDLAVLFDRLPAAVTPGGGRHLYVRSDGPAPPGSKLAYRLCERTGELELICETRGQGHYVLAPGSPADCHPEGRPYVWVREPGPDGIPVLPAADVAALVGFMAALDERPAVESQARAWSPPVGPVGDRNQPGDDFNRRTHLVEYMRSLGWTVDHVRGETTYLTRPGKSGGVSASVGHCKTQDGLPRLYVFSSNAAPLEPNTSYDAYGVYARLKHGGDLSAAARQLAADGYGDPAPESIRIVGGQKRKPAPAGPTRPAAPVPEWVPFPTDLLPEPLRSYVKQSAASIGCDEANVAVPLLTVFAGIIGNRRRLGDWNQPCCLWSAVVGRTGQMKSPAWKKADDIADRLDQELEEASKAEREAWGAEADPKARAKPPARKLIVEDITIETVAATLADNPNGLLVSMDELSVWFDLFTRYRKGGGSDVSRWLGMFEGGRLKVGRRTTGELYVPHALVSVVGTIQPGILARAIREEERESGFLSRLLLVYPPERQKRWTGRRVSDGLVDQVVALASAVHAMKGGTTTPLQFCPEGHAAFVEFYNQNGGAEWLTLDDDRRAAMAKAPRILLRLSLLHHCLINQNDDDFVGMESFEFGRQISSWLLEETCRVYRLIGESPDERTTNSLCEWIRRKGGRVTPRDVFRGCKHLASDTKAARELLDRLAVGGYGRWEATDRYEKGEFVLLDQPAGRGGEPDDE